MNRVQLIGALGKDPEFKYTSSGQGVCNFSMATSESYKDKNGETQKKTEWHSVVVWGKLAELANVNLKKGSKCFVEGALTTRSWDNKDGQKQYKTEVTAKGIEFFGGIKNREETQEQSLNETEEDLPF